jgi:beta-glucosidase
MSFPRDFRWGLATSAYQVEGAVAAGGRGLSIWDTFCRVPGAIEDGTNGDVACDHYNRFDEDVRMLASLGVDSYRFSIAWPRLLPDGAGPVNETGVGFYRRLCERLREHGVAPVATLYHWDLPAALQAGRGWAVRDTVERFAEYAALAFERLGDLVDDWITVNEPFCVAFLGYGLGVKAPGTRDWREALVAGHHVLLAHARAVEAYRACGRGRIGIALNVTPVRPASDDPADLAAARRLDGYHNRWFLDAVFRRRYPDDMVEEFERRYGMPDEVRAGELAALADPGDFLGVNFYTRVCARANPESPILGAEELPPTGDVTAMGWEIAPDALHDVLRRVATECTSLPLLVTENGAAFDDVRDGKPVIDDPRRVDYLRRHVAALQHALADGVDLRGYFPWSFLDNFEWEQGYSKRFGLVYVDYATQERIPKQSALWYRDFIAGARNGG